MFGIIKPDGTFYIEEHCVDNSASNLQSTCDTLNADEEGHAIVKCVPLGHAYLRHRAAWRNAIVAAIAYATEQGVSTDVAYWENELKTFDELYQYLPREDEGDNIADE